jgi:anti-sigma factor (TIGR02949 family)
MSRPTETMDCSDVLARLEELIDGDLSRDESAAMRAHLAGCTGCAREARLAEAVQSELGALPEFDTPPEVLAAVRWTAGSEQPGRRPGRLRPVLAAAAAVLVAALVGLLWLQQPPSSPSLDDPEVARAAAETRYALALVGAVGRRAGLEDLFGERVLSPTVRSVARSLRERLSSSLGVRPEVSTEDAISEGSQG